MFFVFVWILYSSSGSPDVIYKLLYAYLCNIKRKKYIIVKRKKESAICDLNAVRIGALRARRTSGVFVDGSIRGNGGGRRTARGVAAVWTGGVGLGGQYRVVRVTKSDREHGTQERDKRGLSWRSRETRALRIVAEKHAEWYLVLKLAMYRQWSDGAVQVGAGFGAGRDLAWRVHRESG